MTICVFLFRRLALLSVLLAFGLSPVVLRAELSYTVRKNDTVYSIARAHNVNAKRLAQINGLSRPDKIYVGQRLIIPGKENSQAGSALPADFRRELDRVSVKTGRWKYVVIHHSATANGNVKDMDRYHREQRHMENGLAYHFVIGNGRGMSDGEITAGRRWLQQLDGGHLASASLNKKSIGICLVGNFDTTKPTSKQMASLKALTEYLLARCDLNTSSVKTHQQINTVGTRCPGKHFPAQTFVKGLKD